MLSIKRSYLVVIAASLATWSAAACGDDDTGDPTGPGDPGPMAGTLAVTLTTPNDDDGAILLEVTGPNMTQVTAANSSLYFRYSETAGKITAVFVGDVGSGDLLSFRVPDVDAAGSYSSTILALADRDNELRDSAGYELTVD